MKPLEIGETTTLENGDVVRCVIDQHKDRACDSCCFLEKDKCSQNDNDLFECRFRYRNDLTSVHFELVEKIPQSVEEIRKE